MYNDDSDREQRLLNRAYALTDPHAWREARFRLLCSELRSRAVPDGVDASGGFNRRLNYQPLGLA